jgi:REP element-mobilizing transposase RayT
MDNILKLIEVNPNYIMIDIDSKIRNNFGIFINNLKSVTSRIIGARYPHLKSEKGLWSQNYFVVSIVNQEIINIQQKLTMECTQERNICLLTTHENYSNEDIQNYLKKNIS